MRNMKKEKSKNILLCVIIFILCCLILACDNTVDTPETQVANGYGRISILFAGEDSVLQEAVRTVLPSTVFDKYVYTFTKAGEGSGVEKAPDNQGFFTLEIGSYTVAVQAYIGNAGSYTLAASGTSLQFSVGSGSNNPIEVRLSGVADGTEGEFSYTITMPENAGAEITLQKWPDMNNITLNPVNISHENGKTQTLQLGTGSYLLTVLVSKNELYAGIIEIVHIYPALSTVYEKVFNDNDLLAPAPIPNAEIIVTAPVKGAAPNTTATGTGNFTTGAVSWSPVNDLFLGNAVYTAAVTLTANSRCSFNGLNKATINGQNAVVSNNTGKAVTLSYTFPATSEKTVTGMAIKMQPDKLAYTHGDTLDLAGLVVTMAHDDSSTEDVTAASFASKNITANPSHGNNLARSTHNGQPVRITYGDLEANTNNLTVNPKVITVDTIPAQTYTGNAITPSVTVKDGTTTLTLNNDYMVTYSNNTNVGTATVTISGAGNYAGSTGSRTFTINPKVITFTIDAIPAQTYTGSVIQPSVTVKDGTTMLTLNTDYTVEYANNINMGIATINGVGNYAGSTGSSTFTIIFIEMVYVPGGSFQMGKELGIAGSGDAPDITPVHTVTLSGFYMGKYEVTQELYQAVMGSNPSSLSSNPASGEVQEKRPVEQVSWYNAIVFCNKLSVKEGLSPAYSINGSTDPAVWGTVPRYGNDSTWDAAIIVTGSTGYRLPTEAQWEYAAKGGNGTPGNFTYSGSNTVGDVAWYNGNSNNITHEVGKKVPNGLGIYDMSGNVREWCWDWFVNYSSGAQTDPVGPSAGGNRVIRGGCWYSNVVYTRSAYRDYGDPYYEVGFLIGFRLVRL